MPLPDKPLTREQFAHIIRATKRFASEHRRSMAQIARSIDVSAGHLSNCINHKFEQGECEDVARKLFEFIERETSKTENVEPSGFVRTGVAERMMTAIDAAVRKGKCAVLYGAAGIGKSMTLEAARSMKSGAMLIRAHKNNKSAAGMASQLGKILGAPKKITAFERGEYIVDELKGTGRPLLIDEAHGLLESALEYLRDIHDMTGIPIVFVGTIDIRKRLDDSTMYYAQWSRRIAYRLHIDEAMVRTSNPRPLFTTDEIVALFSGQGLKLTDDGAGFLTDLANAPGLGALGLVVMVMDDAAKYSRVKSRPIDAAMCRKILQSFHDIQHIQLIESRGERSGLKVAVA